MENRNSQTLGKVSGDLPVWKGGETLSTFFQIMWRSALSLREGKGYLGPCTPGRSALSLVPFSYPPGYRWHSPDLEREARMLAIALLSSRREGWARQVEINRIKVLTLVDQDRHLGVMEKAKAIGAPLEHVGRGPLLLHPFRVSYQGCEWVIRPLEGEEEWVPPDAHFRKLLLQKAGIEFDTWHIAEELPKPSPLQRAGTGASVVGAGLATIALGVARLLGAALSSLAALDPALVGTLRSLAHPDQADWYILARWYH